MQLPNHDQTNSFPCAIQFLPDSLGRWIQKRAVVFVFLVEVAVSQVKRSFRRRHRWRVSGGGAGRRRIYVPCCIGTRHTRYVTAVVHRGDMVYNAGAFTACKSYLLLELIMSLIINGKCMQIYNKYQWQCRKANKIQCKWNCCKGIIFNSIMLLD